MLDHRELLQAVACAERALLHDPVGHLALPARAAVLRALGPVRTPGCRIDAPHSIGHVHRTRLFLRSVEQTLRRSPSELESEIRSLLEPVERHLHDGSAWDELLRVGDDLESRIQSFPSATTTDFTEMYLLQAVSSTIETAMGDWPDPGDVDDLSLDRWDAPMYLSWVWSGGAPWEPQSNALDAIASRRDFWQWFLTAASSIAQSPVSSESESPTLRGAW